MRGWVKLPSAWIEEGGLHAFRWAKREPCAGASEIASLMVLMAIAHRADLTTGIARVTYGDLAAATGISRSKIADGLDILAERAIIERRVVGRSTFALTNYGSEHRWAQLPAKPLYDTSGVIIGFEDFHLRKRAELDALKIYLAIAADAEPMLECRAIRQQEASRRVRQYGLIEEPHLPAQIRRVAQQKQRQVSADI